MKNGALLLLLGAATAYIIYKNSVPDIAAKRAYLKKAGVSEGTSDADKMTWYTIVDHMSDKEINVVYEAFKNYVEPGKQVPAGSDLQLQLKEIGDKYNIFT